MLANSIPLSKRLDPYVKLAEEIAHLSPCIRRKYGAVIAYESEYLEYTVAFNERVSDCCYGSFCSRNAMSLFSGGGKVRVEVGAEVHAETAALIKAQGLYGHRKSCLILVGFLENGTELYGTNVYPCHVCALNIRFAGFKFIYIKEEKDGPVVPVSIAGIIKFREEEWLDPN